MLMFGVAISALPVILLGIFSYSIASTEIQRNAGESKTRELGQLQANIEYSLRTADHALNYFANSSLLTTTLNEPLTPKQFRLYNQIRQEITHLQTFDTGVSDVVLISTEKSWFIHNNGLYRLDQVAGADRYFPFLDAPFESFWTVERGTPNNCGATVLLVKKLPVNSNATRGLAISEIPACQLSAKLSYDEKNESVMIADRDMNVFLHVNAPLLERIDIERQVLRRLETMSGSEGQFPVRSSHASFTVTYKKSDYNGWTYLSFISIKELNKQSRAIGWLTVLICVTLLVLALAAAWMFSRSFYHPLKKLFRFAFHAFQTDKPAADGFEFITQQIRHVLDKNSRLEHRLQQQVDQLKVLFMLKLFRNEHDPKEVQDKLASFGFRRDWSRLSVMAAQIEGLADTRFTDRDMDLLLFAINNIVEELIPSNRRLTPIVLDQTQATIVLHDAEDDSSIQEELSQLGNHVRQTIHQYLGTNVSIGISSPYRHLSYTGQALQEGLEALKNRFRLSDQSIIFYRDLPQGRYPIPNFLPSRVHSELYDAVKLADREAARQLLHQFFSELSRKQLGPKEYELWTARLLLDFVQLTHTLGIPYVPIADNSSIFQQLFNWRTPQEIEQWIWDTLIEPIIAAIEERTKKQYKQISRQMLAIIHEDFEKDISLDAIAGKLHYNSNYISVVFRKETGISFSEYLAEYRHGKSIEYLLKSDFSIQEISRRLRYNNAQNFIRSFRRIEGVTPGQYRETHSRK